MQGCIEINQENINMVSKEYKGLLQNSNGTWNITPQFRTWSQNPQMQLREVYSCAPNMPPEVTEDFHPKPTDWNLKWSYEGEWGPDPHRLRW